MDDPEELFVESDFRRNKFSKDVSKRYTKSKGYRFLIYDDDFQTKLKDFRDQFGRMRSKHRKTLEDLSLKINSLERRLSNARSARDAYLDYLRLKYPLWKPMLSSYAGVPRKETQPSNPLESIWENVNRDGNLAQTNPMFNCYQTQKEVHELATQMRELQLRLAHPNSSNYTIHPEAAAAFQSHHAPPNFYAYEQNVKYPMINNMDVTPDRAEDHLRNEVSAARQSSPKMNPGRTEKETKTEEVIQERAVTFPSVTEDRKEEEPKAVQSLPVQNKPNNSSSQIMNLLSKKAETSDDSDDDIDKPRNTAARKPNSQIESSKPADTKGSLSMYLKKIADNDSSSSEDIFAPVKKLGRMDSDSDFFG